MYAYEQNCFDMHEFFTKVESSWCNYQKAIALDTMPPKHLYFLSEDCRRSVIAILALI